MLSGILIGRNETSKISTDQEDVNFIFLTWYFKKGEAEVGIYILQSTCGFILREGVGHMGKSDLLWGYDFGFRVDDQAGRRQ